MKVTLAGSSSSAAWVYARDAMDARSEIREFLTSRRARLERGDVAGVSGSVARLLGSLAATAAAEKPTPAP